MSDEPAVPQAVGVPKTLKVIFEGEDELVGIMADAAAMVALPYGFTFYFYQTQMSPTMLADLHGLDDVHEVPGVCVARITLPLETVQKFYAALGENIARQTALVQALAAMPKGDS